MISYNKDRVRLSTFISSFISSFIAQFIDYLLCAMFVPGDTKWINYSSWICKLTILWLINSDVSVAKQEWAHCRAKGPCLRLTPLELRMVVSLLKGWKKIKNKNTISWCLKTVWNSNFSTRNKVLMEHSHIRSSTYRL